MFGRASFSKRLECSGPIDVLYHDRPVQRAQTKRLSNIEGKDLDSSKASVRSYDCVTCFAKVATSLQELRLNLELWDRSATTVSSHRQLLSSRSRSRWAWAGTTE